MRNTKYSLEIKLESTCFVIHGRQDLFSKVAPVYANEDNDKDDNFCDERRCIVKERLMGFRYAACAGPIVPFCARLRFVRARTKCG
jgi:hypothetical protein